MTGYTVHTGTSLKFSEGWDRIFAGGASSNATPASSKKKPAQSTKSAELAAAKVTARGKKVAAKRTSAGQVQTKRAAQRSRSSGKP